VCFELETFEAAFIDSWDLSFKAFFYRKGDVEGFKDKSEQVGVRQGAVSSQIINLITYSRINSMKSME